MSMPRRRIIRPAPETFPNNQQRERQLDKLRTRLDRERGSLARWMSRLKRSFHAVEKCQKRLAQIERTITRLEE